MTRLDQLFEQWALQTPTHEALLGVEQPPLTFAQMGKQLRTIRMAFRHLGLDRTSRLALLVPNGPDLALAFLAGVTSAICAPLNPAYRKEELAFYLDDLRASALLIAATLDSPARDVAQARGIPILELHTQPDQPAGCFTLEGNTGLSPLPEQAATPEDVALILHTSGTTARPKQVPLTQANLCASIHHLQQSLALTPEDRCLNLMPLFHIHGLVGALLAALGSGGSVVCPPGFAAAKIFSWLQTYEPTWYSAVPTLHQAILAQARREPISSAKSALRFIRSSSASLPPTVMAELEEVFDVPVIEAYGMTEAAHQMASNPLPPAVRKPGSVGLPAGPEIAILSESGDALTLGEVGEVAIKGPNVMTGYAQNPTANVQAFTHGWFRTGDQGYLDPDGYLFLTGRFKELINRGGEKIAPLEIDQALLKHPSVQQAVTFAMPHPTLGEEVAAAVVLYENARGSESALQNFLAPSLADFKIPRRIVIVSDIPKGPTGKLQRIGLAEKLVIQPSDSSSEIKKESPRTDLEHQIAALWSSVLGQENIALHDSFLQLGGDSIKGAQLLARIREQFQVEVSWLDLFQEASSVAGFAALIQDGPSQDGNSSLPPLLAVADRTQTPLAFVQESMWLATQLDPDNTAYNRPLILDLKGRLDVQALERSLAEIVRRHESLRTIFPLGSEGPQQIITPAPLMTLPCHDLSHTQSAEVEEAVDTIITREVTTSFDVIHGPVFRAILIHMPESAHRLVILMHHLVADGWSDGVLFRELESLYNSFCQGAPSPLPELAIQYGDFVLWQQQWLPGTALDSQITYWNEQLGDGRSLHFLQGVKPLSTGNRQGRNIFERVLLSDQQTHSLKAFARQQGVTPFTVLLAGFLILLHRWTQKNDLSIGVPIASRIHPLLEPLIGLFANTLPFRSSIDWEQDFQTFIQQLHGISLRAFSHADVSLQELRKMLGRSEHLSGDSLFQVMFVFENAPQYLPSLKDVTCQQMNLPGGGPALVNLSLFLWDQPQGIQGHMIFSEDDFEQQMMSHVIKHYSVALEWGMHNPATPLSSLPFDTHFHNNLLPEHSQPEVRKTEASDLSHPAANARGTTTSSEDVDPVALRRQQLQERVAKLSQSKQDALNKKLKRHLGPSSG